MMNWQLNVIRLIHFKNTTDSNTKTVTFEGGGFKRLIIKFFIS